MGKTDLHIHSTASDGQFSPSEVVNLAAERGLEHIALTDHDTYRGYEEARREGKKLDVNVLTGMEVTSDYGGRECHLLAYCFNPEAKPIQALQRLHTKARLNRARQILEMLRKWGFEIDMDEVKAEARGLNIARPHIAQVLIRKGYVANFREAFMRYLNDRMIQHVDSGYEDYKRVIRMIRKSGGLTIIAHPGRSYTEFDLNQFLEAGIDGIEYIHPSHNYKIQKRHKEWAAEHQLLITGGSDFHGNNNTHMQNFGILTISNDKALKMIRIADQREKLGAD